MSMTSPNTRPVFFSFIRKANKNVQLIKKRSRKKRKQKCVATRYHIRFLSMSIVFYIPISWIETKIFACFGFKYHNSLQYTRTHALVIMENYSRFDTGTTWYDGREYQKHLTESLNPSFGSLFNKSFLAMTIHIQIRCVLYCSSPYLQRNLPQISHNYIK